MTKEQTNQRDDASGAVDARESAVERQVQPAQTVSVAIRLQSVDHSEQPVFSNITTVQGGSGLVFIDFGFVEPQTMAILARLGQPGVNVPESIAGNLACRLALSLETTANLANQLNQLLRSAAAQAQRAQPAASAHEEGPSGPMH